MRNYLLISILSILTACGNDDIMQRLSDGLDRDFTYIPDDGSYVDPSIFKYGKFSGDCEEYAMSAVLRADMVGIELNIEVVESKQGAHAVACDSQGLCLDNLYPGITKLDDYKRGRI